MPSSVKGKCVFLSGPMSDQPSDYHAHDFVDAHIRLKRLGAKKVYNPAVEWLRSDEEHTHEEWMRLCISELLFWGLADARYDMLVQLPGWEFSDGARIEREVAFACGIEVCELGEVVDG